EFKIGTLTFTPQDLNAKQAIQVEGPSGPQFINFPVWKSTVVPDNYALPDSTPPTLTSTSPADNATGVAIGANIVLNFNEAVNAGSGNVVIHRASDGAAVATISVLDINQASFSGTTLTINPSSDLAAGTAYYVTVDGGAIKDTAGN